MSRRNKDRPRPWQATASTNGNGHEHPRVFWIHLKERTTGFRALDYLLDVAGVCGAAGYIRIKMPYARTDLARNLAIESFMAQSTNPNDVLVMLDNDHEIPPNTVERLASYEFGVTAALAYRRGDPFDPIIFVRCADGAMRPIAIWEDGVVIECDMVGHGAIAIKRWVFDKLQAAGWGPPFYRYEYPEDGRRPSEDMYFGRACETENIKHYCDTGLVIPHIIDDVVDDRKWRAWLEANPNQTQPLDTIIKKAEGEAMPDLEVAA